MDLKTFFNNQIIKFGFVGVIATVVDLSILIILKELAHVETILSAVISFSVSVIVNYILSMRFVFRGKERNKIKEFIIFVCLSIIGLLINRFIMQMGVNRLSMHYLAVKFFSMIFVSAYNFITRKIFLEK